MTVFGRAAELALLDRAVDDLVAGESPWVEICGPHGSGRSALVRHVVNAARSAGALVLSAFGDADAPGNVVTELKEQLNATPGLLVDRSRRVLVAVDDADQIDPESREWLAALAGRAQLMIIAAATCPVLPGAAVVMLRPLPVCSVELLVDEALGASPGQEFAAEITRLTGGLPALVHAVLDRCTAEGDLSTDSLAALAADVVGDRVPQIMRTLAAEVADLVRAISVCGPSIDFSLVCTLVEMRDFSPSVALDVLIRAGLVTDGGAEEENPVLAPGVAADRVLESISRPEREDLHARAARLGYQAAVDESEVARILTCAPPLGDRWVVPLLRAAVQREIARGKPCSAARYLERALCEPLAAATRAELVVELALTESIRVPSIGDRRLARFLLAEQPGECAASRSAAADQLFARGDSALIRRTFGALPETAAERAGATALYWTVDDAPLEVPELGLFHVPEPLVRLDDPQRAGPAALRIAQRGEDLSSARSLARTALADPSTLLMCRLSACSALFFSDDVEEAVESLGLVLAEAQRRRLNAVAGRALVLRARFLAQQGFAEDAADAVERATAELPAESWHPDIRTLLIAMEAWVHVLRGRVDLAEAALARVSESELGFGHTRTILLYARGTLAKLRGDARTAVGYMEECGRRMRAQQILNPAVLPWRTEAAAAWHALGEHDRAEAWSAEALSLARRWGAPSALASAHLSRAALDGDGQHLRDAVHLLRDSPYQLLRATALLDLAGTLDSAASLPLVQEAARIAAASRCASLIARARGLGWVPGA